MNNGNKVVVNTDLPDEFDATTLTTVLNAVFADLGGDVRLRGFSVEYAMRERERYTKTLCSLTCDALKGAVATRYDGNPAYVLALLKDLKLYNAIRPRTNADRWSVIGAVLANKTPMRVEAIHRFTTKERNDRWRQILLARAAGRSYNVIGQELDISGARARDVGKQAFRRYMYRNELRAPLQRGQAGVLADELYFDSELGYRYTLNCAKELATMLDARTTI